MKLYSISDDYIKYLRKYDKRVYDNKEDIRKVTRKYLGIVIKVNKFNYYVPMSSPKNTDYEGDKIRKSIIPIIRIISQEESDEVPTLKGTLRISNMIPVPETELVLYEPKLETNKNYKILVEKELEFINKNKNTLKSAQKCEKPSIIIKPMMKFLKYYLLKGGMLEGASGFLFCKMKYFENLILQTMIQEKNFKGEKYYIW